MVSLEFPSEMIECGSLIIVKKCEAMRIVQFM